MNAAEIYAAADGRLLGYRQTSEERRRFPPPAGVAFTLACDPAAQTWWADFLRNTANYSMPAGVLTKAGSGPVTVSPPGAAYQDWQVRNQIQQALDRLDNPEPLTNAEIRAAFRRLFRLGRHLLRQLRDLS